MSRSKRILQLCSHILEDDNTISNQSPQPSCSGTHAQPGVSKEKAVSEYHDDSSDVEEPFSTGNSSDEYLPSSEDGEGDHVDDDYLDPEPDDEVEVNAAEMTSRVEVKKKRRRNVFTWKKSLRKTKRLRGEEYIGFKNRIHPSRPMLPSPCVGLPKHKCSDVKEEDRTEIYNRFRLLENVDDQRQFVANHVEQKTKKRTTRNIENSRKTYTNHYTLTVENHRRPVCRKFFMSTLNVTDAVIRSSLQKVNSSGILDKDRRGKHIPHNKLNGADDKFLRDHILSFPAVESHYCRQSSSKLYLDATLNISIMHRLYKEKCMEQNRKPVSAEKYRSVFQEYNLGFFKPKKDQCKKCVFYFNATEEEKGSEKERHENHIKRKVAARNCRDEDKQLAKEDPSVLAFNSDLQAVLYTPKGKVGQIFYLRKLAVYNFTIYNLATQEVDCYLWDETQGKRGSNEICSFIFDYVMNHPNITAVRMMSDGCGGQQKNSILSATCLKLLQEHPTLQVIDHKFFEPGHTEMECDSIHSKIEQKAKNVPVFVPEGWAQLVRDSRRNPFPYNVRRITFDDIYDYRTFSTSVIVKNSLPFKSICWIHYEKKYLNTIFYKTDFDQEEFSKVSAKKSLGRPRKMTLLKAYRAVLPIQEKKFDNLQTMCKDKTIEKAYHDFYNSLKTDKDVRDALAEPDDGESEPEGFFE